MLVHMQTTWMDYWVRFGGLCSAHNYKTCLEKLATDISQLLGCSLLAIEVTASLFIYVYVRKPQEHEKKHDPYIQGPFSLLNNGYSSFQCIPAGMGLCRV